MSQLSLLFPRKIRTRSIVILFSLALLGVALYLNFIVIDTPDIQDNEPSLLQQADRQPVKRVSPSL